MKDKRDGLINDEAQMEWNVIDSRKLLEDEMEKLKFNKLMVTGLRKKLNWEWKIIEKAENDNKFMADIVQKL